jgi:Family of unknown function (DUF6445)
VTKILHGQVCRVVTHGDEAQPVIIIDNFFGDPDQLVEDASMLSFRPIGAHYPGVRAVVSPRMVRRFLLGVSDLIAEVFGIVPPFDDVDCWYSMVTTPPEALTPIQRFPHFDSCDPGRIALLHYLGRAELGGTSFFRHRGTGFESVSAEREATYAKSVDDDAARHGMPTPGYIAEDTVMFERIAHYKARFNRAIIYRGNTLHCADIPTDMALSNDPQIGRLTVNSFIHGRLSRAA